jgi:hypothetical protein
MQTITAEVLTTQNGNLFIKFFNNEICAYTNTNFTIQRPGTYEEWERATIRWGSNTCTSMKVPLRVYNQTVTLFEGVEDWEEEIDDTCTLVGKLYTLLQPNGTVEQVIWITGKQWHSYEGATGYEPIPPASYELRRFTNGKDAPPANRFRRRIASKK